MPAFGLQQCTQPKYSEHNHHIIHPFLRHLFIACRVVFVFFNSKFCTICRYHNHNCKQIWSFRGVPYSVKEFDDFNEKKAALSQAKQALLQKRLNGALKRVSSIQVIQHRPDVNAMPLSFAQDRLWFLSQFEPDNPGNNRSFALHIKGPLDAPILSQAINDIFFRHDILRSSFSEHDGVPVQTLLPTKTLALPVTDFSDVSLSDQFHRVGDICR